MKLSLAQWLDKILALHPTEIEMGLARIKKVAERLEIRAQAPVITVAGTNGKGSTVALLDALATASGLRVGVYTSPHILHFNERIRIAGEVANDASLCAAFEAVETARGETSLTFFEFTTLAALWLFEQAELDLWVLEVGLGGRLDAVNIIDPDVAIVTSISLDHTDWLGDGVEHIAAEKAGIARANKPLLYGMQQVPSSVSTLVNEIGALLEIAGCEFGVNAEHLWWHQQGTTQEIPLNVQVPLGEDNFAIAVQALAHLHLLPPVENLLPIALATQLAGRSQYFYFQQRHWYLDVGHNPEAVKRFFARLPKTQREPLGVCAMLLDKSVASLAEQAHQARHWFLADLAVPRGGTAQRLSDALSKDTSRSCHPTVAAALSAALRQSEVDDTIVVIGSFYTVAEAEIFVGGNV